MKLSPSTCRRMFGPLHQATIALAALALFAACTRTTGQAADTGPIAPRALEGLATPVNDRDYYPAVMKLIENARKSIEVCLYQVRFYEDYPDSDSNNLVDGLADAARRGVDVTVVIDVTDWREGSGHNEGNRAVGDRLVQAGAAVFLDDPVIQSHQKLAIFDRDVVVITSTNWSHYSLNINREAGVILWDTKVGLEHQQYFAERVADATPYKPEATMAARRALNPDLTPEALGLEAYDVASTTYLNNRWFYPNLAMAIRSAEKSVDVVQIYAYYYGGSHSRMGQVAGRPSGKPPETELLLQELIDAHNRGVKVRMIMDHTWSDDQQRTWNKAKLDFADRLEVAGVEVYRDDPTESIHAKMLLIDDDRVMVGSTNWSFDALELNNEASILIESPDLVRDVYRPWVDGLFEKGTRYDGPNEAEEAALRR